MTIVFSGFRNKDWEKLIESHGGKVTSSISKNTTLLVVSKLDDVSAKVQKARELGVKIIQMDAFMQ
jgi:NAD-dependent DNA ligase